MGWPAAVINVYSGDTITVAPAGDESCPIFVRLYGIVAPKPEEMVGQASRQWLSGQLPLKSRIEVIPMGVDSSGRVLGLVARDGRVLNGQAVLAGQATLWKGHCQAMVCRSWAQAEKKARDESKGVWKEMSPTLPALEGGLKTEDQKKKKQPDPFTLPNLLQAPGKKEKETTPPLWIPLN